MTYMMHLSSITNNNECYKGKKPYKSWIKDGVHGGPCSMEILVNWLAHKPNFKRWKREDYSMDRVPKKDLLEEIIEKLRQAGIYHRLPKDVASKISTLQSNYRIVRKWKETEGYKLKRQPDGYLLLKDELVKRFPYWNQLDPVFSDDNSAYHDMKELLDLSRRKEMERMQASNDMLYLLKQNEEKHRKKRLLLQYEKTKVEREFIHYLHKAGFSPSEALFFLK